MEILGGYEKRDQGGGPGVCGPGVGGPGVGGPGVGAFSLVLLFSDLCPFRL